MLAGVLATPCLGAVAGGAASSYEGYAALLSVGGSLAVLGWVAGVDRREPVLSWHPVLGIALVLTFVRAGISLASGRPDAAYLQISETGRVIFLLFLALQLIRDDIQLEALGLAVAGGVLGYFGPAAVAGVFPVLASPELQAHAAVAMPVLLGFERTATRVTTRWTARLAIALAALAVIQSPVPAACAAVGVVIWAARWRGAPVHAPRRDAVQHGVLGGLAAQLLLGFTPFGAIMPSGWVLLGAVAGGCVRNRSDERLPPSRLWLVAAPLALWMFLATAYIETRRLVGARLWHQARVMLYLNEVEIAHALFHQAADARGADPYTQLETARVCMLARDSEGARTAALRAVELAPANPGALEAAASVSFAANEPAEAVRYLETLQKLQPRAASVVDHLPRAYLLTRQYAAARQLLEEQVRTYGPAPERLAMLGEAVAGTADAPGARAVLESALKQYPGSVPVLIAAAQLERATGKRAAAERYYRRALDVEPRSSPARVQLGLLLREAGRTSDSAAMMLEASLLDPTFPHLREALWDCLPPEERLKVGTASNREMALRAVRIELAKTPDHADLARVMAMEQAVRGDVKGAVAALEKLVARDPSMIEAWSLLGYLQQKSGNAAAARTALERVRALAPPSSLVGAKAANDLKGLDAHH